MPAGVCVAEVCRLQHEQGRPLCLRHVIPCILATPEKLTHDNDNRNLEILFDQIHENHERAPLNALDWAYTCKRMREEFGLKVNEIAQQCAARGLKHMSRPHISNLMRLTELPEWAQAAIRTNRIQAGHGKHLFAALHSPAVEDEIRKLIEDQADDPPSVRELQNLIDEAYSDNHRVAYELSWPGHEKFFDDLASVGVVEIGNGRGGITRYVVDKVKYEEARDQVKRERARPTGAAGEGSDSTDEDDERETVGDSSERDDEADEEVEDDEVTNPLWTDDGEVHPHLREREIYSSIEAYARRVLLNGPLNDPQRLCGLGAWRAYDLGKVYGTEWNADEDDMLFETEQLMGDVLKELDPELFEGSARAWADVGEHRFFDVMVKAGRLVVECSSRTLLAEMVATYNITLDGYRIDEHYLKSLNREAFTALLNSDHFEGGATITATKFSNQVETLLEVAERFGIPESVQTMWDEVMTIEASDDE